MIRKLESLGHVLEMVSDFRNRPVYKCIKCYHYFRENFFHKETIMESHIKERITNGYITSTISNLTCDETIVRDIIE
jgi:hypothetical protein